MFKHIPVLGAIFPAAAALWFVHPNSATATVAGVSGAAALAEVKLKAVAAERRKRKAAKAVAAAPSVSDQAQAMLDALRAERDALPPAQPAQRPMVIDQQGQTVERFRSA